jgi:hypothetical protein
MTNDARIVGIAQLETTCPPAVAAAAIGLVAIKHQLDVLARSDTGTPIVEQLFPDWRGDRSIDPWSFAKEVLPFFWYARSTKLIEPEGGWYKALVPTEVVIGQSWRWTPTDLDNAKQIKVIDTTFSAFETSKPGRPGTECAQYCYIRPLGIVLAHEGKNRVALFRKRALPHIPALVSDEDYPIAERVRIFEMPEACLAVLDGRFVERVGALVLVRGLTEAYGVQVEKEWPADFASLDRVLVDLNDARLRESYKPYAADMDKLRLDAVCSNTEVEVTLLDVEAVQLPPMKTFVKGGTILLILLLAMRPAAAWPDLQILISAITGALGMLLTVPLLPLVRCKVRHLKEQERMNRFFTIRQQRTRDLRTTSAETGVSKNNVL